MSQKSRIQRNHNNNHRNHRTPISQITHGAGGAPRAGRNHRITKVHQRSSLVSSAIRCRDRLTEAWRRMPSQCSNCGGLIKAEAFSENNTAWCPHCQKVAELPLLKLKDWITGTVLLLIIKVQAGL